MNSAIAIQPARRLSILLAPALAKEPVSPWEARGFTDLVPPDTLAEARAHRDDLARLLRREHEAGAEFLVQARTWVTLWNRDLGDSSLRLG